MYDFFDVDEIETIIVSKALADVGKRGEGTARR